MKKRECVRGDLTNKIILLSNVPVPRHSSDDTLLLHKKYGLIEVHLCGRFPRKVWVTGDQRYGLCLCQFLHYQIGGLKILWVTGGYGFIGYGLMEVLL